MGSPDGYTNPGIALISFVPRGGTGVSWVQGSIGVPGLHGLPRVARPPTRQGQGSQVSVQKRDANLGHRAFPTENPTQGRCASLNGAPSRLSLFEVTVLSGSPATPERKAPHLSRCAGQIWATAFVGYLRLDKLKLEEFLRRESGPKLPKHLGFWFV